MHRRSCRRFVCRFARLLCVFAVALATLASPPAARAWHQEGHALATRAALASLADRVPKFMTERADAVVHYTTDPDFIKHQQTPQANDVENPEHYLDFELLQGAALPPTRYEFVAMCAERKLRPEKVGTLPYALVEWTQRLTLALAEHRRWPDDPYIQAKCLVDAGILAHYAQDLCQPLHTTVHYDGRVGPDGRSPASGIHMKVDALPGDLKLAVHRVLVPAENLVPAADTMQRVMDQFAASHKLVDRVYELEGQLGPPTQGEPSSEVALFAVERAQASAELTAVLFLTAWQNSATIEIPSWVVRAREATGQ